MMNLVTNDEFSIFHLLPNMLVSCLFDAFVAEKLVQLVSFVSKVNHWEFA